MKSQKNENLIDFKVFFCFFYFIIFYFKTNQTEQTLKFNMSSNNTFASYYNKSNMFNVSNQSYAINNFTNNFNYIARKRLLEIIKKIMNYKII
jgi:hypothetical protein